MLRSRSVGVIAIAVLVTSAAGCSGTQAPATAQSSGPSSAGIAQPSVLGPTADPASPAATTRAIPVRNFRLPFTVVLPPDAGIDFGPQSEVFQELRVPDSGGEGQSAWFLVLQAVEAGRVDRCASKSAPLALDGAQAAIDYLESVPTIRISQESATTLDGFPAVGATIDPQPATNKCRDLWLWATDAEPVPDLFRDGFTTGRVLAVDVNGEIVVIHTWAVARAQEWLPIAHAVVQSIDFDATPA